VKEEARVKKLEKEVARVKKLEKEVVRMKKLEKEVARVKKLEKEVARVKKLEKEVSRVKKLEKEVVRMKKLEKEVVRVKKLEKEVQELKRRIKIKDQGKESIFRDMDKLRNEALRKSQKTGLLVKCLANATQNEQGEAMDKKRISANNIANRIMETLENAGDGKTECCSWRVVLGDEFISSVGLRYRVLSRLKAVEFSEIWRVRQVEDGKIYILKAVTIAAQWEMATREDKFLKAIDAKIKEKNCSSYLMKGIDVCHVKRLNCVHVLLVVEELGVNLYDVVQTVGDTKVGLKLSIVKKLIFELLTGLQFLHEECRIIHTDVKPENILITDKLARTKHAISLHLNKHHQNPLSKIIDFGVSLEIHEASSDMEVTTRPYRAPEVVFGLPFNEKIDIWSVGCTLYELLTSRRLFSQVEDSVDEDFFHLADMEFLIGHPPKKFTDLRNFFEDDETLIGVKPPSDLRTISESLKRKTSLSNAEIEAVEDMIKFMLVWDSELRPTAKECLDHPFWQ